MVVELARVAGAGSGRTGPCERERKAARGLKARPGARDCHGANGGGIGGGGDADRYGGGGRCLIFGILPGDGWGAGSLMGTPLGLQSPWSSVRKNE